MKRHSILYAKLIRASAICPAACAALLLAMPAQLVAQDAARSSAPGGADAAGAVVVPPVTDPGISKPPPPMPDTPAVKPPPMNVDPEAIRKPHPKTGGESMTGKPGEGSGMQAPRERPGSSMKDQCKGSAELCEQESAR